MRKLVALAGAVLVLASPAVAGADPVTTPVGTATANDGGYVLLLEGNDDNFGPLAGYVAVYSSGRACADDHGSAANGSESPTCTS